MKSSDRIFSIPCTRIYVYASVCTSYVEDGWRSTSNVSSIELFRTLLLECYLFFNFYPHRVSDNSRKTISFFLRAYSHHVRVNFTLCERYLTHIPFVIRIYQSYSDSFYRVKKPKRPPSYAKSQSRSKKASIAANKIESNCVTLFDRSRLPRQPYRRLRDTIERSPVRESATRADRSLANS